jgi:hypothetical protein
MIRRVGQLEKKVESLVSLLKTTQKSPDQSNGIGLRPDVQLQSEVPRAAQDYNNSSSNNNSNNPNIGVTFLEHVDEREAADPEVVLSLFREQIAAQFPFIIIPNETTANDLQRTKPFLYKIIVTIFSVYNIATQTAMSQDVLKDLSNRLLLEGEKSLDLLQGLMVFITWYNRHPTRSPLIKHGD